MVLVISDVERSVSWRNSIFFYSGNCCLFRLWMLSKSQVIRWGVVDSIVDDFVVVLGQDVGWGSGQHDSVIEEEVVFDAGADVVCEVAEATEDIASLGFVEGGDLWQIEQHFDVYGTFRIACFLVDFFHVEYNMTYNV